MHAIIDRKLSVYWTLIQALLCGFSLSELDEAAYLPFVPEVSRNGFISNGDDISERVHISNGFPFGTSLFSILYVRKFYS